MQNHSTHQDRERPPPIRYGCVCSGVSAPTLAVKHLGWKTQFFSEIEKFPRAVLAHHYPDVPLHGDFTTIQKDTYGTVDALVGGTGRADAGLRRALTTARRPSIRPFPRLRTSTSQAVRSPPPLQMLTGGTIPDGMRMPQASCRSTSMTRGSSLLRTVLAFLLSALLPVAVGQVSLTTAQIAKRVSPTVVVIQGKTDSGEVQGSGFVISKDGKIVTNLHVIKDLNTAKVQLADGKVFDSLSVLAVDERRDLAIIKISGLNLTVLPLGNADTLAVGERVVVVGSPLGLDATVTAGILSAIRDSGDGYKLLQTDAAVNHGKSGGPLVGADGSAVGVVSSIVRSDSAQGLNFAIPINYVRALMYNLHDPMTLNEMRRHLSIRSSTIPSEPKVAPPEPKTAPVPSLRPSGPSLFETLEFLKSKIPVGIVNFVVSSNGLEETEHFENWYSKLTPYNSLPGYYDPKKDDDECFMRLAVERMTTFSARPDWLPITAVDHYEVHLGVIRETTVQQWETGVVGATFLSGQRSAYRLTLLSNVREIRHDCSTPGGTCGPGMVESTDRVTLLFGEESLAQRVADAFKHAAELCKAKEPF